LDWRHVQGEVAKFTRVCAYDRAGSGFSDAANRPSDIPNTVDDLHRLLLAAPLHRPIIYVGHSIAGYYGTYFEAVDPQDIAGAVFVDPAFPNDFTKMVAALPAAARSQEYEMFAQMIAGQRVCLDLARKGALWHPVTTDAKDCVDTSSYPDTLDAKLRATLAQQEASPQANSAMLSAVEDAFPTLGHPSLYDVQIGRVHPDFGNKPLIVLTEGNNTPMPAPNPADQAAMTAAWRAGQKALAQTSTRGVDVIVPNTGHYIQIEQPLAVIDAIRQVVLDVRDRA
jgi:pimeloyl-ACP methyl ester carboxylesterase